MHSLLVIRTIAIAIARSCGVKLRHNASSTINKECMHVISILTELVVYEIHYQSLI